MVLLGTQLARLPFDFFLMFCTLVINFCVCVFVVGRAVNNKRMLIKIKICFHDRGFKRNWPLKHTAQHIITPFKARVLFIIKHALLDEVGTSNTVYVPC